jgi:hypothetical protein
MTQQPKALQLADELDSEFTTGRISNHTGRKAATELRRQHDEIERLTKLCDELICRLSGFRMAASMQKRIDELKEKNHG